MMDIQLSVFENFMIVYVFELNEMGHFNTGSKQNVFSLALTYRVVLVLFCLDERQIQDLIRKKYNLLFQNKIKLFVISSPIQNIEYFIP